MFACNNDIITGFYLGNAGERSIYDCWHDEKLMNIWKFHKQG